ncbi:hypothetical protein [Lyngbya sp. PCC 8106]|nr:hypothetical protein [Lyngbya sp. PCC 8106]
MIVKNSAPGKKPFILNINDIRCVIPCETNSRFGYSVILLERGQHQIFDE